MDEIDFGGVHSKTNGNIVKVTLNEFRNIIYLHIREYQIDGDDGYMFPTSKGITINPEYVDVLVEKLIKVSQVLTKLAYNKSKQLEFDFKKEDYHIDD